MPKSLVQIYTHITFSTKGRKPFLRDREFRNRMHRYLAGICGNLTCPALIVGGVEDHVHILCRLGKTNGIAGPEQYHRCETFQDELRRLCRKYGVEIDERYVWD